MIQKPLKWLTHFFRKSVKPWWNSRQWRMLGCLALITFAMAYVGYYRHADVLANPENKRLDPNWTIWDIFFMTVRLFKMSGEVSGSIPLELQVARFMGPAILAYATFKALVIIFQQQILLYRLKHFKGHIIVCGLGRAGFLLARAFQGSGHRVVVIDQDKDNSHFEPCRELDIISLTGNAEDREMLIKARIDTAKYLFVACGNDSTNVCVAVHARALTKNMRKKGVLTCFIHISSLELANMIREKEIATPKADAFRLEVFNVFESGARILAYKYINFSEISGQKALRPHLLVIGFGYMGECLVLHAAKYWRILRKNTEQRLTITIVDKEAVNKKDILCLRYPRVNNLCNIIPYPMEVLSPEFHRAEFLYDDQGHPTITNIFFCQHNDAQNLSASFLLKQILKEHRIPIVVQMEHSDGLANILHGLQGDDSGLTNIHPFAVLDHTCKIDFLLGGSNEILARAIHEKYILDQSKKGFTPQTNPSMIPWDELPQNLKESNRYHADHISVKLKAIGCDITQMTDWDAELFVFSNEEIDFMAKMEHDRWVDERIREGWDHAPGTKDLNKKTSPYMVPWEKLSEDIRDIDRNLIRGLPSFLARAGFMIYRLNRGT